jgi:membrane associated rhomboid family serine protease
MEFSIQESVLWGANVGALHVLRRMVAPADLRIRSRRNLHIAFNMWCLWNLGELCESLYGRWTYAAIYLICGLGASLASAWHPYVPSVGASGAIFGLAGALIAALKLGEFSVLAPHSAARCVAWVHLSSITSSFGFASLASTTPPTSAASSPD